MIFIRAMTSPDEASRRRALLQRFRQLRFMLTDAWCPSPYHHLKYREKRKRERKENTYPTTLRACLETDPPSIQSLPFPWTLAHIYFPRPLSECLSSCLPFTPCPNIWPFCWQIKLHSFFPPENTGKGQFVMLLPAYFCVFFFSCHYSIYVHGN